MIRLIEGLPGGVIGIEAIGTVTADDDRAVVTPELHRSRGSASPS
ncbi:hypothetical protein [Pseudonocardia acidicola]|nr:hypothetical protein [Pseudonocardia acidicola]